MNLLQIVTGYFVERTKLSRAWLSCHPTCEACGSKRGVEVHHVQPFHLFPALELKWSNLMSLCRECHFRTGHSLLWAAWNPHAREDAALTRSRVKTRRLTA